MQHHRDLQILRDEAKRRLDDVLSQVRSSEEKAIAQSRQIDNLQSKLNQLFQPVRQQQTPTNIATPQHNMTKQHNFSLPPPPHTQSYTPTHTQVMFNLRFNSSLIGILDKFEKSMAQQNNVLHKSLRQSVTASKEHYLNNAKPCDGKIALDFSTWLEDVSRISSISHKDPESVALATSRGSLHKYVRELHSSGKHWPANKPLL